MRNLCAVLIASTLLTSSAFAADAPLAPGKPAGLQKAQDEDNTLFYILGLGAIAAGVAIIVSGDNNNNTGSAVSSVSSQ